jgi:lambda repressor-like predicted transcriptional regulator
MAEHGSRDEHWADVVSQWRASGLSQKEFCRRRDISDRALNSWLYKSPYRERVASILAARSQAKPDVETSRFLPVCGAQCHQRDGLARRSCDHRGRAQKRATDRRDAGVRCRDAQAGRGGSGVPDVLSLTSALRIFLAVEPADMRKGFDGLSQLVRDRIAQDPLSGHLYVFRNKRRDRIKILYWDRDGFALWCKRLEKGTFRFGNDRLREVLPHF